MLEIVVSLVFGEVLHKEYVTPGMVRIVFGGEELTAFETTGTGDEYLRLHFPVPATGKFVLPAEDPDAPRGWRYPEGEEPSPCQPYTVRRFDSETSRMTIDFVVHEGGIASDWAQKAEIGDKLAIGESRGLYEPPADARWQVFVADATGLPALGRLIEQLPAGMSAKAIVEVVDESHKQQITSDADVEFIWLVGSGNGVAPSKLPDAVRAMNLPTELGYVWVAGESTMLRDIRKYLRHELKLPGEQYKVIGYWTYKAEVWNAKYEALDESVRAALDAAWESDRDEEEIRDEVEKTLESAGL
ncbi:siderophore-interacting protein [Rhodococcus sp. D-46]|jgi:NADPH-dependent ferric siderophore reductase|uniref:siderophore-interacting protein n=1 Tax=Rhodococcus sp. D-46 TaxID=2716265 RepID=UPI0006D2478B|nr:NADPH-dependent ferric siderophore reductase [Rhodococcus sp. 008]ARE35450.1 NADPH-dependent ferric siderophore reductase [Rhodococcus sp. BH4]NHE67869.1 siderophore-interacting protein [Rhodococcus sp. D-46]OKA14453.1 NADPH-dependent ferric siderophore reductase [Rhodococcus erythropolis]